MASVGQQPAARPGPTQSKSVFEQIANAHETWPQGEGMPSPFDLVIKRSGTGQFDTEYTVNAVPYSGSMPPVPTAELPDMEKHSKGIPIKQVLEGKRPAVIQAGGNPALPEPEPKNPTHADAEKLESGDVVIKDLDTSQEVNLDEIPF